MSGGGPPARGAPQNRRRLTFAVGLAGVFTVGVLAGWSVADPGAFAAAIGGIAHSANPTALPAGPEAPGGPGAPVATVDPGSTPGEGQTAGSAPIAAPSASPAAPSTRPAALQPAASPVPAVPKAVAARLDRALARAQERLLLPGVEATVIFADGSTWTGALGMADVKAGRPVSPETPFAAASVTKTFTAALILRYVDRGLIGLDDPLARWLPDWPNGGKITIRMLLNHTSGIPDFFRNPAFDVALNKAKKQTWTAAQVLGRFVPKGAVFSPGTSWSYSNTNYLLLGVVAAQVGGAPWEELVRREVFEPLGLSSTYVQAFEEPLTAPALAYRIIDGFRGPTPQARTDGSTVVPFRSVVTAAGPAGAIASTSENLARWARALYGGSAVLSAATRREMLTFVKAYSYGLGTSYGLGVSRVKLQGRTAYGHSGALVGTRAAIRYFPKEKLTMAVLFNRDTFVGDDLTQILARALFPEPLATPSPPPSRGTSPPPSAAP